MKENIKLAFEEPDFRINHKKERVRCILNFSLKGDQKVLQMLSAFYQITKDPLDRTVVVDVKPSNGDAFCVDTGMKVARARAEKLAYRRVSKFLQRYEALNFEAAKLIDGFFYKANSTIEHNDEYLKQF
jgi:hypothetical protein